MHIAVATATFYNLPFDEALALIRDADFEYVELDAYWKGGDGWEAAQHLNGIKPGDALKMIREGGLRISALHDMGGVIHEDGDSLITPDMVRPHPAVEVIFSLHPEPQFFVYVAPRLTCRNINVLHPPWVR